MEKILLSLSCIFLTILVSGEGKLSARSQQSDTVNIKKVLKQIARDNTYQMDSNPEINQNQNFQRLLLSGTTFDFLKIAMENKSPVVRLYAFKAVAQRMDAIPEELITKFKKDSSLVKVKYLDSTGEAPVNQIANGFLN